MLSRTHQRALFVSSVLLTLVTSGCLERQGRPVNPCTQSAFVEAIQVDTVDKVDVLFMVDNSGSMVEEQTALTQQFDRMVRILTSGDFDQDGTTTGEQDFEPVNDLNIGVISSDMGTGGNTVNGCSNPDFGDDGVLRTRGNTASGCMATYPNILNFRPMDPGANSTQFADDFRCVATGVGTGGCGFEQQLDAILKAASPGPAGASGYPAWVAPTYAPPLFYGNTNGHGDGANLGFVREGSVLALIPVTDEDDCSATDTEIFNTDSATYSGVNVNLRCSTYSTALHNISRYVDGFMQLRTSPNLLVYAPIVGVPTDLVSTGDSTDFTMILGDSRMINTPNEAADGLVPSCNTMQGLAYPPVRMVQVAEQLAARGAGVTVQSICQSDFSGALQQIIRKIADALGQACLPRALNTRSDGTVNCDVKVTAPAGMGCSDIVGAMPRLDESGNPLFNESGQAICEIEQLVPSSEDRAMQRAATTGQGWYYDDYTAEVSANCSSESGTAQRIAFTREPPSGAVVELECLAASNAASSGAVARGTFCDPDQAAMVSECAGESCNPCPTGDCNPCGIRPAGTSDAEQLRCDPYARTCGITCQADADCRARGLVGFVCDLRPYSGIDEVQFPASGTHLFEGTSQDNSSLHRFCVNPTCE